MSKRKVVPFYDVRQEQMDLEKFNKLNPYRPVAHVTGKGILSFLFKLALVLGFIAGLIVWRGGGL